MPLIVPANHLIWGCCFTSVGEVRQGQGGRLADVDMALRGEAARSGKKKPQLITVGALVLVEAAGVEPVA